MPNVKNHKPKEHLINNKQIPIRLCRVFPWRIYKYFHISFYFFVEKFRAKLLTKHFKHIFPIAKHFSLYFINKSHTNQYLLYCNNNNICYLYKHFFLKHSVDHIRFLFKCKYLINTWIQQYIKKFLLIKYYLFASSFF